ncbi:SDR family NAD(P)-dependent oxidoreductase [Pseudonocardia sp. MH-G8]|uniref:SDR family NAD(P)-dependent oxidoreductase n=1 Tax=Pseudonocardia sp. MH-G8 TaxID=1854588 RepID=UPI0018E9F54D|nr:SDR family oxidoreductase [Pseudonocardia sp. MH-G8]
MSGPLADRTVLVTGAARGIGAALAWGLTRAGARVCLLDRIEPVATARTLAELGSAPHTVVADLADTTELERVVDRIRREVGPIHGLVNNAGLSHYGRFNEVSPAVWREVFAVNVDAPFFLSRRIAEHMIADGVPGALVHVTSKNALVAEAGLAPYNASKAALEMLSKSLASELGAHGVRSNCVAPGMIDTRIADAFAGDLAGLLDAWRARIPLRHELGAPEDVVGAVEFLLADASRYVTGATVVIDGGALADQMPRERFLPPFRSSL